MDHSELDRMIAKIRATPDLVSGVAREAAWEWERTLQEQIREGRGPDGEAWARRKEDQGQALQTAAKALVVVPVGTTLLARLKGHVARHHLGRARGGVTRAILPSKGIPKTAAEAIRKVFLRKADELYKGP